MAAGVPRQRRGHESSFQGNAVAGTVSKPDAERAEDTLQPALHECVARAVRRYLKDVESEPSESLHALVMREVETPLLREVMAWYGGNQSRVAVVLGINRGTLRKKLLAYGLID